MRHVAREEGTGAGSALGSLLADLEGELAFEHPGDLIAVVMQVMPARRSGGRGLLEHHDAVVRLAAEQLQVKGAARRARLFVAFPAASGYDDALGCGHGVLLRSRHRG